MLSDEEKKAIKEVKHFNELTRYWQEEEYEEKDIAEYITTILNLIEKQSKEIEELSDKLTEKICKGVEEEILEEYRQTIISKDKEIEELKDEYNTKLLNNAGIYQLGFKDGKDSVKNKIKAKIEEIDIEIQCCEYADDDTEEYKQDIEKEKRRLLRDKAVLQSLLEKE